MAAPAMRREAWEFRRLAVCLPPSSVESPAAGLPIDIPTNYHTNLEGPAFRNTAVDTLLPEN